jgi:glutathione S-transferase
MITVYGTKEAWGVPDISPACLKLKTYLRMVGLEYKSEFGDPRKGPTRKIPYIDEGDGKLIGDSSVIIEHLKKKHGDKLDAKLSAGARATGHAVQRMLEENTYWVGLMNRWSRDGAFEELKKVFAPVMPPVIGGMVMNMIRRKTRKNAFAHGMARHSMERVNALGCADLDALSTILGDKPYLLGSEPTSYDCVVYGYIANILATPASSVCQEHAAKLKNLVAHRDRIRDTYWKATESVKKEEKSKAEETANPA